MTITGSKGGTDLAGLTRDAALARARELAAGITGRRAEAERLAPRS